MKAGWQRKIIGEVLEKTETINPMLFPEKEFIYIDVSSVSNQTYRIENTQTLTGKDAPSRARRLIKTGDVLFATVRPTLKRIAIVPEELDKQVCSTGYFVLRPKQNIDNRYVYYYLLTDDFISQMQMLQKGASYPAVTDEQVRSQYIPIPPLPEQQRIVAILDEAFAAIAAARANAETNLRAAREVFESHLNQVFSRCEGTWTIRTLGDLFDITSSKRVFESDWKHEGVPFYRAREIVKLAKQGFVNNELFISEEMFADYSAKYGIPQEGDLMVTGVGTLGVCYVVRKGDRFYFKDGNIIWLKSKGIANSSFVEYAFRSEYLRNQINDTVGATVGTFTIIKAKNTKIPLPSLHEQKTFVVQLDAVFAKTKQLETVYQQMLVKLDELKQSLLHHAFTGQL